MPLSYYLANEHVESSLRSAPVYLALFTSNPGPSNSGGEVSGGGYTRMACTWTAADEGDTSLAATVTFPVVLLAWGAVTYWGIFDAETGGNLLRFAPLDSPYPGEVGTRIEFSTGSLLLGYS